jgi:putative ABC transport system permease protein
MSGQTRPPLLGRVLLRLCRLGDRRGDVIADMRELFEARVASTGRRDAARRFNADALSLLLPARRSLTSGWRTDVRDAARALRRTPLQTASIFLCLLLGTTMTVVMFTVVNTLFAGDLPGIEDRGRLMRLTAIRASRTGSGSERGGVTIGRYQALPASLPGVEAIAFQLSSSATSASVHGVPLRVRTLLVNGDYFGALRTPPAVGRLLQPGDDRPGSPPVIVLGFDMWRRVFGSAPDAVGKTIGMGPHQFTIIGVAPKGFGGIGSVSPEKLGQGAVDAADLWMSRAHAIWGKDAVVLNCADCAGGQVVFRLNEGVSPVDVERDLSGYALEPFRLTQAGADAAELVGGVALLMAVPFLVLAIACTNVAGVQLSRALRRTPELATRVALGATRGQLTRLISLETALLAFAAGLASWFVTVQALRWTEGLLPVAITADGRVFAFALLMPLIVTFAAGLLPSWRATGFRVLDGLQQGAGAGSSIRVTRLRHIVLSAQIALSVALLGTALHLARGVAAAPAAVAPPQADVLVATVRMWDVGIAGPDRARIRPDLERRLRALPGITAVGLGDSLFSQTNWGSGANGMARAVTRGWFDAIGHRVIAGRLPDAAESGVVVINATLAEHHGGAQAAVGTRVKAVLYTGSADKPMHETDATVIGVIEDGYERAAWGHRVSIGYLPVRAGDLSEGLGTFFVKGPGAAAAERPLREMLARVHPQLAPYEAGTIEALVHRNFRGAHLSVNALAVMSAAALLLAAVGLFGAISQSAAARVREFGVRLALGARPVDIGRLVLRETAWVSGIGLGVGLVLSTLAATGIQSAMLETTTPADPVPPGIVITVVMVIAVMAALTPARRVMAIDPVKTLRAD